MARLSDKMLRRLLWLLFALAVFFLAAAFYIPAKAVLAQALLHHAWARTVAGHGKFYKPWPWADTWPVARLIVPAHEVDQIVLYGDKGNSLAFAPGMSVQSFSADRQSAVMISAHRDTQFHFLKNVAVGEIIELQNSHAALQYYQVRQRQVIDARVTEIRIPAYGNWLFLVTCYPFDSLLTGGSKRYVVSAVAIDPKLNATLPL